MNKITALLVGSALLLSTVACSDTAKTSADAPNAPDKMGQTPTSQTTNTNKDDATNQVRKDQLNSDIRAREQRNNTTGGDTDRANGDLSSEVRSKLEANIPKGNLAVDAKDGGLVVSGTVQTKADLDKIEPLAKQIKGVKTVNVTAKVMPAVPDKK